MRLRFLLIALVFVIGAIGTGLYSTSWTYDFGIRNGSLTGNGASTTSTNAAPDTTLFKATPPALGGIFRGFVGNAGGGLYSDDPGLAGFGSNTELRLQAASTSDTTQINKFAVSAVTTGNKWYYRILFLIGSTSGSLATSGDFCFFIGTGTSYTTNVKIGSNQAIVGMKWAIQSNGSIVTSWMVDNVWTSFSAATFQQNQPYVLEFFVNNGNGESHNAYKYNGTEYTVPAEYVDLWVNGTKAGGILANSWTVKKNTDYNSWMFYGLKGGGTNPANAFFDNVNYINTWTTGFTPTYTEWYSKGSGITGFTGNLYNLANWGSNPDGSGVAPTNFTTAGNTYYIRNYSSPTIGTAWTVSGTGSKVILGDGTDACNFTIPADLTMSGIIDVSNAGNLILMGANPNLTLGTLAPGSTVSYSGTVNQDVKGAAYSNLQILGSGTKTLAGATSSANPTTVGDGRSVTLLIPETYAFTGTIDVNNNGTLEIANSTLPTIGTLANGSTVRYAYSGNQNVTGTTYYNLDVANGADKTMLNDVSVTNLTFNTGTLALNNYNLYLAGKPISFYSTNAVFSSLSVNYTDAQVGGQGVGRIWDTNGSFTNSVDVTFTYPAGSAPNSLYLWYKGDSGVWTKGSAVTHSYGGGLVTITVPGITSLSGGAKGPKSWTFAEGDQTLPVELSSFTAMISSTNYVQLTWITQSETNVAGFRIFRNTTDDLATAEMLNTFVQATNTSQMQVYVYTDEEIQQNGTYYYWLQNLDLDGSFTFHGPTTVTITGHEQGIPPVPVVLGINNAYPNPFNPTLTIKYGMTKGGNAALDIYNQRGQLVRNLMSGARESGSYSQIWDGRDNSGRELPSGVYFIRLQAAGKTFGHKVVLLK